MSRIKRYTVRLTSVRARSVKAKKHPAKSAVKKSNAAGLQAGALYFFSLAAPPSHLADFRANLAASNGQRRRYPLLARGPSGPSSE